MIIEIKKTFHKTLGRSHLSHETFESVAVYIVRNRNNHSLTQLLRLKEKKRFINQMYQIMWRRDAGELTDMMRRLKIAKGLAWN